MMKNTDNIQTAVKKNAGDEEAMEVIEDTKEDIEYIQEKEAKDGYGGQPSIGRALELEGLLATWYPVKVKN